MKKVEIYTDGACSGNPGAGGYGAILICNGTEKEISGGEKDTTNNRMELMAPIKALSILKESCEVDIYSDSSYVVNSFCLGWIYSWEKNGWQKKQGEELKNVDLLMELLELCRKHKVNWHKVKGHSDNEYNNRCDRLAVNAIASLKEDNKKEDRTEFYDGELKEEVLSAEDKFTGRVFTVRKLEVRLPDGRVANREVVIHCGGAAICAVDSEGYMYMVKQFRIAASKEMLEIPAGKLEAGEDPKECAIRELKEETGVTAKNVIPIVSYFATPGYCTEKLHIFYATDLEKGNPDRDEGEFLHVKKYKVETLLDMVNKGEITDGKTVIAILWAIQNMKK